MSPASIDDLLALFDEAFIDALYRTVLGREPDPVGKAGHLRQLRLGHPKEAFIADFAQSPEGVAHGARVEGLAELCTRAATVKPGRLARWLARVGRAAGLSTAADLAAIENRLGRQLQATQASLRSQTQTTLDGLDRLGLRAQETQDQLGRQLPPLHLAVEQVAHIARSVASAMARNTAQLDEYAAQTTGREENAAELYRRMVLLGQTMSRLEERVEGFEHQMARFERQVLAADSRQREEVEAMVRGLQDAVERLELRLSMQGDPAPVAAPGEPDSALRALDTRAVQRVRQRLGGSRTSG
jgi:hypothetical protein